MNVVPLTLNASMMSFQCAIVQMVKVYPDRLVTNDMRMKLNRKG